ncbi:unnamed protein product [Caenorhabditis angaria]|uniref:UDP-glucuronosyltransferase n=1 Tax=Caenorhabditis angaria TaxID=860376 RepID=A0A9P1J2P2_9PELO|nr:unnamed protein product [Caenorhabditis angaria]
MILLLFFLTLLWVPKDTESAKILVYCPSISKSHVLLCAKYADLLHNAQHDTVLFIPTYTSQLDDFNGAKHAKVWRLQNISSKYDELHETFSDVLEDTHIGFLDRLRFEYAWWIPMCKAIAEQKHRLQHLIDYQFDMAIVEDIDYCNFAVVRSLGIKNIALLSSEPLMDKIAWDLGIPAPASYVPSIEENPNHDRMGFFERLVNTYKYTQSIIVHHMIDKWIMEIFRTHVHPNFPSTTELVRNVSVVFVNTNEMFDIARPVSSKIVYVGMLKGSYENATLCEELDSYFNKGINGSIFISFGTVAPFKLLPSRIKRSIIYAIEKLQNYHFVLKLAEEDLESRKMFDSLKNINLVDWVPQNAVLKHPNLKLFVSHGGMNSVLESMSYGVPMVLMPVFTDQFKNAKTVERRGAGKMISRETIKDETFYNEISNILENSEYQKNAKRIAKLIKTRPFSANERVLKWIDFVLKYPVNLDLQSNNFSLFTYFHFDVLIFIIFSFIAGRFIYHNIHFKIKKQ